MPESVFLGDDIDLVLNDHDPLDPDQFERHEVLFCLRLRAGFICRNHEHGTIHQG
jgi:hypothetical protein